MAALRKCATIILFVVTMATFLAFTSSMSLRAVFDMSDIRGEVKFVQSGSGNTTIMVNLTGIATSYTWKVHKYPVVYRGNSRYTCQSLYTGGVFDPLDKMSTSNYTTLCNASSQACAVGDLSGKHGPLTSTRISLTDPDLPLGGPYSIFGRSLVFYNGSSIPAACAFIDSPDHVITAVATFRGSYSGITGTVTLRQPTASMDTSVDVNLFYSNDATSNSANMLSMIDQKLPEEGVPSYEGSSCPTITSKNIIDLNNVTVSLARNGPSAQRLLMNTQHVPLSGAKSVIGKTLVVYEKGSPIICASIYQLLPIEAEADFDVDGVKGWFHFKQDSELSPTIVTANVTGLDKKANTYHVHVYQVSPSAMKSRTNMNKMCADKEVAGHWKPYGTTSRTPGVGTVDQYEVGDLSGKYGTIGSSDSLLVEKHDYNLPLFGANSILFRSLVIHYTNSSRWVCTNIKPKNATFYFKASSEFKGPAFTGFITVEQASFISNYAASHIASFFLHLRHMNSSQPATLNHNWHIHTETMTTDYTAKLGKRCNSAKGHYNPYQVSLLSNYSTTCGPMNMLRCELGDSSSKLGKYKINDEKNRFCESENYFASLNTIIGRSFVVHAKDGGAARLGCANIKTVSSNFVQKELTHKKANASNFASSLASELTAKQWQVAQVHTEDYQEKCQTTKFILIEMEIPRLNNAYENLKKKWPTSLKSFTPIAKDECSHAVNLQATYFIPIIAFSLLCIFK